MTQPHIPAPGRDLANESPHVPPASREVGPATSNIVAWLTMVMGGIILAIAAIGGLMGLGPGFMSDQGMLATIFIAASGLCFIGCGIAQLGKGFVMPVALLVAAAIFGFLSTVVR